MLQYVHGSYSRYKDALDLKRKQTAEYEKRAAQRKRTQQDLRQLKVKKAELDQEAAAESQKIQSEIALLEKQLTV